MSMMRLASSLLVLVGAPVARASDVASLVQADVDLRWGRKKLKEPEEPAVIAPPGVRKCVDAYADGLDRVKPGLAKGIRSHPLTARRSSDRPLIMGAGAGTTGHRSLASALGMLGLNTSYDVFDMWKRKYFTVFDVGGLSPTCHRTLRSYDYTEVPESFDAIMDTPVAELFISFFLSFPQARVILSTRPAEDWAEQRAKKWKISPMTMQEPCGKFVMNFANNRTAVADMYKLNNDLVRCLVPQERLMEVDLWADSAESMKTLLPRLQSFVGRGVVPTQGTGVTRNVKFADMDSNVGFHHCIVPSVEGIAPATATAKDGATTAEGIAAGSFAATGSAEVSLASSESQAAAWTQQFGSMMQDLAQKECDMVLE